MKNNFTETHEFLVSILGAVPFGIMAIDMEGLLTMCNEEALANLGVKKKVMQVIETDVMEYLTDLPELPEALNHCFTHGRRAFDLDAVLYHEKYLSIRGRRILNGMIITIEDVTEVHEHELANLRAMFKGQEVERQRLAKEIHDGIGPVMSTVKLHLDAIKSNTTDLPQGAVKKIDTMSELIQQAAADIRSISHALMPSALMDLGLVAALDNLCQRANDSEKVKIDFYHSGVKERLESQVALVLYRIAQELLNNAFKYSQAKVISVQLIKHPDSLLLMVEDDGVGFDPSEINGNTDHSRGIGLRNIETRTKFLSGFFTLDAVKGRGVNATVEIPLNN